MMKRYMFRIFILLLMIASMVRASNGQTKEYNRKQAIPDAWAEKFKAETGFEGKIGYNLQSMGYIIYRGNFRDIPITAPQDTIAMKKVFEQVFLKVKPYTRAKEGQLVKRAIISLEENTYLTYRQRVNGYGIEDAGELKIDYIIPNKELIITDYTVDISSDPVQIKISLEQAVQIAIKRYKSNYDFDPDNKFKYPISELIYSRIPVGKGSYQHRLCYKVRFSELSIYVDPSSGEILDTRTLIIVD